MHTTWEGLSDSDGKIIFKRSTFGDGYIIPVREETKHQYGGIWPIHEGFVTKEDLQEKEKELLRKGLMMGVPVLDHQSEAFNACLGGWWEETCFGTYEFWDCGCDLMRLRLEAKVDRLLMR